MPDGKAHTKANLIVTPVASGLLWALSSWQAACALAIGMVLGDLLLSPDLDHQVGSQAYKLWGILRIIWWPYTKLVKHRSIISHCPILGTAVRLTYLALIPAAVVLACGLPLPHVNSHLAVAGIAGIEASALVHYALDWIN